MAKLDESFVIDYFSKTNGSKLKMQAITIFLALHSANWLTIPPLKSVENDFTAPVCIRAHPPPPPSSCPVALKATVFTQQKIKGEKQRTWWDTRWVYCCPSKPEAHTWLLRCARLQSAKKSDQIHRNYKKTSVKIISQVQFRHIGYKRLDPRLFFLFVNQPKNYK